MLASSNGAVADAKEGGTGRGTGRDGIDVDGDASAIVMSYSPGGSMRLCGFGLGGGDGAEDVRDEPELYG